MSKTYLFAGSHPQFVTIDGAEYEMHPNNSVDLPDTDYVQTLVAKGFLTPVDAPVDEVQTEEATAETQDDANAEAQNETQADSPNVEAPAPVKKSTKKGAQA